MDCSTYFIFVALSLNKSGKTKGAKIVQMILRLFYLLIIATGVGLLSQVSNIDWKYILKAVAGLWVIGTFEMILSRVKNDRRTSVFGFSLWLLSPLLYT